jgi:hypothetical protein
MHFSVVQGFGRWNWDLSRLVGRKLDESLQERGKARVKASRKSACVCLPQFRPSS